ncbi:MAG: toll/interleukin-1 receptor domain-containing protein [Acidobacteriia bacterium]|nr:toll/interleukin-1 receptor domain-containing protein [Terriglobia bacterium]
MGKPAIFISYRRGDTRWFAAYLHSRINQVLPGIEVFLDVASIEPGLDFEDVLNRTLDRSEAIVVLIGQS